MARRYYFLLTALPELPELGEAPPMMLEEFRELVRQEPAALRLVEAVLLEQDLVAREAALAGERERPEPVVLTAGQASGEEPLPPFLAAVPAPTRRIGVDAMWEAYYRYVHGLGLAEPSAFVRQWVGFEVALRNALASARASALELDPHDYLVAEDLADRDAPVQEVVAAWSAAPEPLSALRVLDQRRWEWMERAERYFSFAVDELAAYARKLVLIARWQTLSRQPNETQTTEVT